MGSQTTILKKMTIRPREWQTWWRSRTRTLWTWSERATIL